MTIHPRISQHTPNANPAASTSPSIAVFPNIDADFQAPPACQSQQHQRPNMSSPQAYKS
ncbi:MAG: hypothetical protein AAGC93_20325 [Cyanobacteria bacterium P01_F01_bin.53]